MTLSKPWAEFNTAFEHVLALLDAHGWTKQQTEIEATLARLIALAPNEAARKSSTFLLDRVLKSILAADQATVSEHHEFGFGIDLAKDAIRKLIQAECNRNRPYE